MGLGANATVATGAKPRNNLILLASSGSVENAMKAGKQEGDTKNYRRFQTHMPIWKCVCMWVCMCVSDTYL